jgi:hypothetical protein
MSTFTLARAAQIKLYSLHTFILSALTYGHPSLKKEERRKEKGMNIT